MGSSDIRRIFIFLTSPTLEDWLPEQIQCPARAEHVERVVALLVTHRALQEEY
jgi:hypothetical protein